MHTRIGLNLKEAPCELYMYVCLVAVIMGLALASFQNTYRIYLRMRSTYPSAAFSASSRATAPSSASRGPLLFLGASIHVYIA